MIRDGQQFTSVRNSLETTREGLPALKIAMAGLCSIGFHGLCAAAFVFATQYSVPTEIPTSMQATLHSEQFLEQHGLIEDLDSTTNANQSLVKPPAKIDQTNTTTEEQLPDTVQSEFAPDDEPYHKVETANTETPQQFVTQSLHELPDNPVAAMPTLSHSVVEPEIFVDLGKEIAVVHTSGEFMLSEQKIENLPAELPKLLQALAKVPEPVQHESTQPQPGDYELEIATSQFVPVTAEFSEYETQDPVDSVEQHEAENSSLTTDDLLAVQNQTIRQTEVLVDHESAVQLTYVEIEPTSEVAVAKTNTEPATENIQTDEPEKVNLQSQITSNSQLKRVATDTQPSRAPARVVNKQSPPSEQENEPALTRETVTHESKVTTVSREPIQPDIDIGNKPDPSEAQVAAYQGQFNQPVYGVEGLSNPKPRYPYLSRVNSEEGKVILQVHVSHTGDVSKIEIQQSSGYRRLDRAAQKAVSRWKFKPAQVAGLATAGTVQVPINFVLSN